MQKKKGETEKLTTLVFITETAISTPIRYAPLSPKKIWAFGKLNLRKIKISKAI